LTDSEIHRPSKKKKKKLIV